MAPSPLHQYLSTYAEPEIAIADGWGEGTWGRVLVVPALGEAELFPQLWSSVVEASRVFTAKTLVILVINAKDSTRAEAHLANEALAAWLGRGLNAQRMTWGYFAETPFVDLVAIDRYSVGRRLKEKQGVGQARKIGCDLALAFAARGRLGQPGMDVTDADAQLPLDYWQGPYFTDSFAGLRRARPAVGLHAFRHYRVPGHERAISEYETFLQYYVDGLARAGSPYAFQTVGSTLRIAFSAYAEVRGFPDREAGEDFYLLNKLAKVGGVFQSGKTITLSGRPSWRVPFGTGQQVNKLSALYAEGGEYLVYDPEVFGALKIWNDSLLEWCEAPHDHFAERLGGLAPLAESLKAPAALDAARTSRKTPEARRLHLQEWFDAFRTLKFVHEATDRFFPRLPLRLAIEKNAAPQSKSPRIA